MLLKEVLKGVKKEILNLADAALTSGAANVGKELSNMKRDVNQPNDINLGAITSALKSGVLVTGQDLLTRGLERVGIPPQAVKSKVSEVSKEE
ncbi:hypothetical protein ACFPVX_13670 [Cohnella faecalis]|uniref:Uncharacterized protein n=1 Tax=Cohnella faecalis TaxID=2315694 RepID=A0A398CSY1_9BACL|nr:hypothetical protein [Cohnella faecalis]RIE02927.1 hypothetical protein D3H35_20165 [Cohnella faecalis]